ncbi:MAG: hypothetical protein EBR82_17150 [Caulobacteraceae bacterium]|nr:hypothetical protein [Caulobacteraceae bacterium]
MPGFGFSLGFARRQAKVRQSYSNPNQYYAGSIGLRWPNRAAALTGTTPYLWNYYANYVIRKSPPWRVPAGKPHVFSMSEIYNREAPANLNEGRLLKPITMGAAYVHYQDAGGTWRAVAATWSNGGVLTTNGTTGGVIGITDPLPADMPPWTDLWYALESQVEAGASFTASVSGNIMTVSAVSAGTITPNHLVTGTGITDDDSGYAIKGTAIQAYGTSGTTGTGSTGTYALATAQGTLTSRTLTSGQMLLGGPALRTGTGEGNNATGGGTAGRGGTASFATQLATRASLVVGGSGNCTINGFLMAPTCGYFFGADGRPIFFAFGNSIGFGKGMDSSIAPDGIMGILEAMCADTSNGGFRIPIINTCVASSQPQYAYSGDANYNPDISKLKRALIDQVTALNIALGATKPQPFTHAISEHGTNSNGTPYNLTATFIPMMQGLWAWQKAWHNTPLIQTTMLQKGTSSDMFQTTSNQSIQTIDQTGGNRFLVNDLYLGASPPSGADYFVNTYAPLGWDTTTNRDKIAKAPGAWTIDATDTGSGSTLVLAGSTAPTVGMSVALNGTNAALTQFTITNTTSGTNTVTTTANFTTLGILAGQTFTPATSIGGLTAGTRYTILSVTNSGANSTFTVSNTLSTASGTVTATVNADARLISGVTGTGPWTCTSIPGSSSGTYPPRVAGAPVYQIYTADGQPGVVGLHWSAPAVALVAPLMGPLKAKLGSWTG